MLGTIVNCVLVLIGSTVGLLFKNRISDRFSSVLVTALGLCVIGIGISYAVDTADSLCVIICMVAGTILGEALSIEDRLDHLGDALRRRADKGGNSRFTEGFVNASVLFCVGSMAVMGSLDAGLRHNYDILISKGVIDGVTAITFAAAMGIGTAFSVFPLLIYQGGLTLLASVVGPYLSEAVITEMCAAGGTIILGIGINMLGLSEKRLRVGNMLPAIFLPIAYIPLSEWISRLLAPLP